MFFIVFWQGPINGRRHETLEFVAWESVLFCFWSESSRKRARAAHKEDALFCTPGCPPYPRLAHPHRNPKATRLPAWEPCMQALPPRLPFVNTLGSPCSTTSPTTSLRWILLFCWMNDANRSFPVALLAPPLPLPATAPPSSPRRARSSRSCSRASEAQGLSTKPRESITPSTVAARRWRRCWSQTPRGGGGELGRRWSFGFWAWDKH